MLNYGKWGKSVMSIGADIPLRHPPETASETTWQHLTLSSLQVKILSVHLLAPSGALVVIKV